MASRVLREGAAPAVFINYGPPLTIVCEPEDSNLKRFDEVCYTAIIGITKFLFRKLGPTKRQALKSLGGILMALFLALIAQIFLDSINTQLTVTVISTS